MESRNKKIILCWALDWHEIRGVHKRTSKCCVKLNLNNRHIYTMQFHTYAKFITNTRDFDILSKAPAFVPVYHIITFATK